jgi:hypothetical protein
MNANKQLAALLGARGDEAAEVSLEFRLLAGSFKRVENCVFFREFAVDLDHLSRPITDTEYEASVNSLHVEDYVDPERVATMADLARVAVGCAEYLAEQLRGFSSERFRVIVSVTECSATLRSATLRFHMIREGESWLAPDLDLERYAQEGLGVIDSR